HIADIGLLGACCPEVGDADCSQCGACVTACREGGIILGNATGGPEIDFDKCVSCGQCVKVCPSGTLRSGAIGYRVLVGGKLGRHPQLGLQLPRILARDEAVGFADAVLEFYKENNVQGERFGEMLNRYGMENFLSYIRKKGILI
ncbi:MAG TPA: 4Fe-4S binding protein, partial [Dissulfurispiraceae bacterium]|nr:4Fe-4S binding protein [Dissulfurispiraceae bacterium]